MGEVVGAVKSLWRFPLKSMRGEKVEAAPSGRLRSVAAERSPEEPVDHLIEEEGVDLVAAPDEFVADAHEVFDERGDFFECEADSTFVSQPSARSVGWSGSWRLGPERVDVFGSERAPTTTDTDGMEATVSDRSDELGRGEPRSAHGVGRREEIAGSCQPAGHRPAPCSDHVGLADVADQGADLTGRHPGPVCVDDGGVADNPGDVIL